MEFSFIVSQFGKHYFTTRPRAMFVEDAKLMREELRQKFTAAEGYKVELRKERHEYFTIEG